MKARQQARSRCIYLAAEGRIIREPAVQCDVCGRTKIGNRTSPNEKSDTSTSAVQPAQQNKPVLRELKNAVSKPWFWEGHVQRVIVAWLIGNGWTIYEHADTAAKGPGKDIVAKHGDRTIWISVKGFPEGTARTSRSTQAAHWFARAVFDLVKYRTESSTASLAIGIPDCSVTYRRLVLRSAWAFRQLPAQVFWVDEFGKVEHQTFE
jgi:hypothetical protein